MIISKRRFQEEVDKALREQFEERCLSDSFKEIHESIAQLRMEVEELRAMCGQIEKIRRIVNESEKTVRIR